jgi:tRNA dimethylallyltransferase
MECSGVTGMGVLVLAGPTATGKTAAGIHLAQLLDGEIISADSRQVYRGLDIGTAKPTAAEQRAAVHHFIDILDPVEEYSAGLFAAQAREVVSALQARGKTPVIVGGSGLYLRALVDGLHPAPGKDDAVRAQLERRVRDEGVDVLADELRRVDPATAASMKEVTARRLVRALEVYYSTGVPLSAYHRRERREALEGVVFTALDWERSALYERINRRCDAMVEGGLLEEIERLEAAGYGGANALHTVGYNEGMDYRRGKISYAEMMRLFKQNSRRYAKRQWTWFRADERIRWFPGSDPRAAEDIARYFGSRR